jgi:hypothetical protein
VVMVAFGRMIAGLRAIFGAVVFSACSGRR